MIPNYESPTGYASLTIIGILPRVHMYVYTWHTSWKLRSIEEPPAVKPETRAFANVRESAADHFRSLHVKKDFICYHFVCKANRPITVKSVVLRFKMLDHDWSICLRSYGYN